MFWNASQFNGNEEQMTWRYSNSNCTVQITKALSMAKHILWDLALAERLTLKLISNGDCSVVVLRTNTFPDSVAYHMHNFSKISATSVSTTTRQLYMNLTNCKCLTTKLLKLVNINCNENEQRVILARQPYIEMPIGCSHAGTFGTLTFRAERNW